MAHIPKFKGAPKGGPKPGETMTGMVKSYNRKGFGFIMCQALDSVDVYFSRESLAPQLQTSDLAGEYVTFDVFRFPDGKFQARNLRPVGDTGITRGPDGFGGGTAKGKGTGSGFSAGSGFSKGPTPTGGREEEDRSRDWYCEKCKERNFVKRSECFKCKAPRPRDLETSDVAPPPPPPRRTVSPHAGSRAMRDMLRKGGGKGGASRSESRTSRQKRRSSSRRGRSRSNARSRSRRRKASKSSSSDASSKEKRKRSQSDSGSSSSSSDSGSGKEESGAVASSSPQEQKAQERANPEIEKAKAEVLQKLLQLQKVEPRETRVRDWRALLREWHPDKNPDRTEVATAVFQFLQKGKLLLETDAK